MLPEPTTARQRRARAMRAHRPLVRPSAGWTTAAAPGCRPADKGSAGAPRRRGRARAAGRSPATAWPRPAAPPRPAPVPAHPAPYCSWYSASGKPPKSRMVRGRSAADTVGVRPSQCAEAITTARRQRGSQFGQARPPHRAAARSSAIHGRCTGTAAMSMAWDPGGCDATAGVIPWHPATNNRINVYCQSGNNGHHRCHAGSVRRGGRA